MDKKIKDKILALTILLIIPLIVKADSGLDTNYESSKTILEIIFSSGSSLLSIIGELIKIGPNDPDYKGCHIVISIISIIIFYIYTNTYVFKLDSTKPKTKKRIITLLALSLIPTLSFSILYILTKLQIILYLLILILYIITLNITTKKMLKKIIKEKIKKLKEKDKNFDTENFNKEAFEIYKEIQIAWSNFEIEKIKPIISKELFEKYKEQLEKLKANKEKNIIEKIEFKKNAIIDIRIENNI